MAHNRTGYISHLPSGLTKNRSKREG